MATQQILLGRLTCEVLAVGLRWPVACCSFLWPGKGLSIFSFFPSAFPPSPARFPCPTGHISLPPSPAASPNLFLAWPGDPCPLPSTEVAEAMMRRPCGDPAAWTAASRDKMWRYIQFAEVYFNDKKGSWSQQICTARSLLGAPDWHSTHSQSTR
jgi:hypothetical protein